MKAFTFFAALATAALSVYAAPAAEVDTAAQYDGVKVLRVPVGADIAPIDDLVASLDLERWTTRSYPNSHVDVEVPQDKYDQFVSGVEQISTAGNVSLDIVTMHEDLGKSIREESQGLYSTTADRLAGLANDAWFNNYHSYADHLQFLKDLVTTFPNNAKVVTSGTSLGGNAITGINIFGTGGSGSKPAIIVHGTVHAREWISTMVTEGLAYNLLANYSSVAEVKAYVDKYDFYFFPAVNPDGFLYTQTNTRTWRKNRSAPPSGSTCYGTDINRNWAHSGWGQTGGASTSPCAEDYKGSAAASAPETKGLAAFLTARASSSAGAKMYFDIHSYSQLFMTPYGYSCSKAAADASELNSLAAGYVSALTKLYGTRYESGPICTTIYQASGSSVDWAYDNGKIKYSFTTELRDTGSYGFILPASQIRPSVIENWAGFKYLLANMK